MINVITTHDKRGTAVNRLSAKEQGIGCTLGSLFPNIMICFDRIRTFPRPHVREVTGADLQPRD